MFKKLIKALCIILCLAMLIPCSVFAEGDGEWEFYPSWQENEKTPFIDVTEDSWYDRGCRYSYNSGYMAGVSEELFAPHDLMTREMAVITLVKMCSLGTSYRTPYYTNIVFMNNGVPKFEVPHYETSYFKDVEPDKWYSDAIQWAYEKGLTSGIGNGLFGIGQPITRQDFLTMLYKIVPKVDLLFSNDLENQRIKYKADGQRIGASEYAQEAIGFFTQGSHGGIDYHKYIFPTPCTIWSRVLCGYPQKADGTIEYGLRDNVTRAQAAAFIHAFSPFPLIDFSENN